ncbi:uncharacterized protein LOC105213938 [Zeugodacus cucurbitae]|nr:uncharacterized protein LOC105213938 [Zeugodacus cucurbitae]
MSLENVFTAMLCFMSTCDNNLGNIQINSVTPEPLKFWDYKCKNETLNFNKKVSELNDLLAEGNDLLERIKTDLTNLKEAAGKKEMPKNRRRRETVGTSDILTHPQFECSSSVNSMKISNAELLPIGIQCESKQYGDGWILLATLDVDHRKILNEKSTDEFVNGFGRFLYGEKMNEYFIGLRRLHEITAESGAHELLILTHDVDNWGETHTESVLYKNFRVAGANNDYRLQTLDGYDGSLIDPLQTMLGERFSITMFCMEQTGAINMFVRNAGAQWI